MLSAYVQSDIIPANTQAIIQRLIQQPGIDAIAVDVCTNAKGRLILAEREDKRQTQSLFLETVLALLAALPDGPRLICILQERRLEEGVFRLARRYAVESKIIYSGLIDLEKVKSGELGPNVYFNLDNVIPQFYSWKQLQTSLLVNVLHYIEQCGVRTIQVHQTGVTHPLLEVIKSTRLELSVTGVEDKQRIKELLQRGIKNVTSRQALTYAAARQAQ